jgi:subtilisin family serine protease
MLLQEPAAAEKLSLYFEEAVRLAKLKKNLSFISVLDTGFNCRAVYRSELSNQWKSWITIGGNWVNPGFFPEDSSGHGTGILSILSSNRVGLMGMNPVSHVLIHKVSGPDARNLQSNWSKAIVSSVRFFKSVECRGVILLASGSWGLSRELADAIDLAHDNDCIVVTIAHNDNFPSSRFPGKLSLLRSNVICVGASDRTGNRLTWPEISKGSNYGDEVSFYIDGEEIPSLGLNGEFTKVSGTSAASAKVAGVVSLIRHIYPCLSSPEIREILADCFTQGGDLPSGKSINIVDTEKVFRRVINL